MPVQLDPPGTDAFISTCKAAATSVTTTHDNANRLYSTMQLAAEPKVSVNFNLLATTGDDYDDVAFLARVLWLDATGADNAGLGKYDAGKWWRDGTTNALNSADELMEGGEDGRDVRDARNAAVSSTALRAAILAKADIQVTDDGLIVVQTDGIDVNVPILKDDNGNPIEAQIPLNARGGTTYGNVFITSANSIKFDANDEPMYDDPADVQKKKDLLHHENRHTYQWAGAGAWQYPILYLSEEAKRLVPEVNVDWDFSWDPIDVDLDWPEPGCTNRFEQHAGLEDGGYPCD